MITVGGAILMAIAMATIVKSQGVPAISDSYFEPNTDKLQQLPANIAVVQPTHFPEVSSKIKHVHVGDSLARTVGRNVTFRELMAEASIVNRDA